MYMKFLYQSIKALKACIEIDVIFVKKEKKKQ